MPEASEVEQLELRKRLLVAKSEIHRQSLVLECEQIEDALSWAPRATGWFRFATPIFMVVAPLAGFWAVRRRRSWGQFLKWGVIGWRLLRTVKPLLTRGRPSGARADHGP